MKDRSKRTLWKLWKYLVISLAVGICCITVAGFIQFIWPPTTSGSVSSLDKLPIFGKGFQDLPIIGTAKFTFIEQHREDVLYLSGRTTETDLNQFIDRLNLRKYLDVARDGSEIAADVCDRLGIPTEERTSIVWTDEDIYVAGDAHDSQGKLTITSLAIVFDRETGLFFVDAFYYRGTDTDHTHFDEEDSK